MYMHGMIYLPLITIICNRIRRINIMPNLGNNHLSPLNSKVLFVMVPIVPLITWCTGFVMNMWMGFHKIHIIRRDYECLKIVFVVKKNMLKWFPFCFYEVASLLLWNCLALHKKIVIKCYFCSSLLLFFLNYREKESQSFLAKNQTLTVPLYI